MDLLHALLGPVRGEITLADSGSDGHDPERIECVHGRTLGVLARKAGYKRC